MNIRNISNIEVNLTETRELVFEGIELVTVKVEFEPKDIKTEATLAPYIGIEWERPIQDFSYCWSPLSETDFGLKADWELPINTRGTFSAPLHSYFDENDVNKYTVALSEISNELELQYGVHEESSTMRFSLKIPCLNIESGYIIKIRMSTIEEHFSTSIQKAILWLQEENKVKVLAAPEMAYEPVYSTWYNFHQAISAESLEQELPYAKKLGFQTVILDDGWQTDDNQRRYAYTGDWQVSPTKFPSMSQHIQVAKNQGFNYLMWYSVPYLGIKSKKWGEFQNMTLYYDAFQKAAILDPRFPEVRAYLVKTYVEAVTTWKLDGLKLDFIDTFRIDRDKTYDENGMDDPNLQQAVRKLLNEIVQGLKAVNPAILIELRQDYTGPLMREFGNIFRVKDCPNNYLKNRLGIVSLRLTCEGAAVHSDMLMWNRKESVESAALQVLNVLYSVPQISMVLSTLSKKHLKMLTYWLNYMKMNRKVLLKGDFIAHQPHHMYPILEAATIEKLIITQYEKNKVLSVANDGHMEIDIVNATLSTSIVMKFEKEETYELSIYNCSGEMVGHQEAKVFSGLVELQIPAAGMVALITKEKRL